MSLISRQIAQHEQKARARYLSAVQHIRDDPVPDWFNDFLEHTALPPLVRVGFDREIAGRIFRISAPAWKSIGSVTDPRLRLHPSLVNNLRDIRRDIVTRNQQEPQKLTVPEEPSPAELAKIAEKAMPPKNLPELLQISPTTWVILPRAHSFLKINDSHCLIIYLQHLDVETNGAFEKILARVLIEFIGNYSLKFINSTLPKKQMVEAIFYGYTAMFWKNLRQPPLGLEDLLIFKNYLSWAKAFNKRLSCKDTDKETVIAEMEEMANKVLPDQNTRALASNINNDASNLHITLRHGRPGINHAVRYFKVNNVQLPGTLHDQMVNTMLPQKINTLFRELRNSYDRETPRTKEFIHAFLMELRSAYIPRTLQHTPYRRNLQDDLAFTKGRMAHLIKDFSRSLH